MQVGRRFSAPVQTGFEAHPAFYTVVTRYFPGVKWPGPVADHPPPSRAEAASELKLYVSLPSASHACHG